MYYSKGRRMRKWDKLGGERRGREVRREGGGEKIRGVI